MEILSILHNDYKNINDLWLQCLVRGRHLFLNKKMKHSRSFRSIYEELKNKKVLNTNESVVLKQIQQIIKSAFNETEWHIGELKSIYYKIGKIQMGSKDSLDDKVKIFLLRENETLITSLPGHEGNKKTSRGWMWAGLEYSPLLNELLTKQILRKFARISIP